MSSTSLFTKVLDDLHPGRMLRTHTLAGEKELAALGTPPPTNEEILDAARRTYQRHIDVVDLHTLAGLKYVQSADGKPNVAALNSYDWRTKAAAPIKPTALAVHTAPAFKAALAAAKADGDVWSLVFGISESAQFIVGEEGGVGIAFALDGSGDSKGEGYLAGKLGLDLDVAVNLNVGIWNESPKNLAGAFYGLEVNLDLEVGVSLGIYVTGSELQYMGFSVGIGAGVGGGATIVGGYTWIF